MGRNWSSLSVSTFALTLLLTACVSTPPKNTSNVCEIFEEKRAWYKSVSKTEKRWGIPRSVIMAFVYQESGFRARAKPPRNRILWIIPGSRRSTAFGYAQALDSTWKDYIRASGNDGASRSSFDDTADFIGWYNAMSSRQSNIRPDDAKNLYLAYHEGNAGFARASYAEKPWLVNVANDVQQNADRFNYQYTECKSDLEKNWFFRLFS